MTENDILECIFGGDRYEYDMYVLWRIFIFYSQKVLIVLFKVVQFKHVQYYQGRAADNKCKPSHRQRKNKTKTKDRHRNNNDYNLYE